MTDVLIQDSVLSTELVNDIFRKAGKGGRVSVVGCHFSGDFTSSPTITEKPSALVASLQADVDKWLPELNGN